MTENKNESKSKALNLLSSKNVFNSKDENKKSICWRHLSNEERIEKLNSYFEKEFNHDKTEKTIGKTTMSMLIELVSNGKLKLKKEIKYDRINERILEIYALVPEPNTYYYLYKPDLLVKKTKSKKIAKNVLFRKK